MHRTVSLAKSSFGDHRVDSHAPRRRPGHHVPWFRNRRQGVPPFWNL